MTGQVIDAQVSAARRVGKIASVDQPLLAVLPQGLQQAVPSRRSAAVGRD